MPRAWSPSMSTTTSAVPSPSRTSRKPAESPSSFEGCLGQDSVDRLHALPSEPGELGRGFRPQYTAIEPELTREGQRARPSRRRDLLGRPAEIACPSPEQPPVAVHEHLGRVEARPTVHPARGLGTEAQSVPFRFQAPDEGEHLAHARAVPAEREWRGQEHPAPVELEQVRALPHVHGAVGGRDGVVRREQVAEERPVVQVVTRVEQDARRPTGAAAPLDGVAAAAEGKQVRIAYVDVVRLVGVLEDGLRSASTGRRSGRSSRGPHRRYGDQRRPLPCRPRWASRCRRRGIRSSIPARPAHPPAARERSAPRASGRDRPSWRAPSGCSCARGRPGCTGRTRGTCRR